MTTASRRLLSLAKLLVGVSLLAFLISRADLDQLSDRLLTLDLFYVALVFVLPHVAIWLSSVKWQRLLKTVGVVVPMKRLVALYMIGTFLNNFLPTMVGGDVVKTYQLSKEVGRTSSVVAATFMERFMGLTALISLLPLILLQRDVVDAYPLVIPLVLLVILGFLGCLILVLSEHGPRLARWSTQSRPLKKLADLIAPIGEPMRMFRQQRRALVDAYIISLVFYVVTAGTVWAAVESTGADAGFGYLFSVVPMVLLAGMVPVSLNGLGITEAGYVLVLRLAGVTMVDAVTMALLIRFRVLVTAVIGGLVFLLDKSADRPVASPGCDPPEQQSRPDPAAELRG